MPIFVGDIFETRMVSQQGPQAGIIVLHHKITSVVGDGPSLQDAANFLANVWAIPLRNLMVTNAQYRGLGVRKIWPHPLTVEAVSTFAGGAGNVAGDPLPFQVAGIATKKTNLPGKSFRGRVYLPFPSEASNDVDGNPTMGYGTLAQTFLAAVQLSYIISATPPAPPGDNASFTPCVWSRKLLQGTFTIAHAFKDKWATQRRRGDFGKPNTPPF